MLRISRLRTRCNFMKAKNYTASEIIESLGDELDITANATKTPYKAYFTRWAYDTVRNSPKGYIYTKGDHEYVKVWDNHVIPFIIHMRIAGIDDSMTEILGCRREKDDMQ